MHVISTSLEAADNALPGGDPSLFNICRTSRREDCDDLFGDCDVKIHRTQTRTTVSFCPQNPAGEREHDKIKKGQSMKY